MLARWRAAMADVALTGQGFTAFWGAPITIEGMLGHAVAHLMRHTL